MAIRIFVTGGTFDKEYNELNGELFFKDTHLHEMLRLGRSKLELEISTLMMIDSLDMLEEDREQIARACMKASEERILITHGTDTMQVTAAMLALGAAAAAGVVATTLTSESSGPASSHSSLPVFITSGLSNT